MRKVTTVLCAATWLAALTLNTTTASAQTVPPPSGVLSLDASATKEVRADIVRITMFTEQQGNDPAVLAKLLNQRTDAALKTARQQDVVKTSTGNFTIAPATDKDGKIAAWRGRSEINLESHDFEAASRLAGALGETMQVGSVSFSLSPEARRQAESTLVRQAITSFRDQAGVAAESFGYKGFTVREVSIGHNGGGYMAPRVMMMQASASPMGKAAAVPIEAGMTAVNVTVSGSIQMTP